eukprot:858256-Rhodomonas_salina.1
MCIRDSSLSLSHSPSPHQLQAEERGSSLSFWCWNSESGVTCPANFDSKSRSRRAKQLKLLPRCCQPLSSEQETRKEELDEEELESASCIRVTRKEVGA